MIFQNNKKLLAPVKKWGCNLMSHAAICERFVCLSISAININNAYMALREEGALTDMCGVLNSEKVFRHFFNLFGSNLRGKHVGNNHQYLSYIKTKKTNATIIKFDTLYTGKGYGEHYMAGDEEGNPYFDPSAGDVKVNEFKEYLKYYIKEQ